MVGGNLPKPNFTGTWTWVPARSVLEIPAPDATVFVIEHQEPLLKIHRTHVVGDRRDTFSVDLTTDGQSISIETGGLQLHGRAYWDGDALVFDTTIVRAGEEATNVVRYTLSGDQRTLVANERLRSLSQNHHNLWVFERVEQ
jgi:hypothetical protein